MNLSRSVHYYNLFSNYLVIGYSDYIRLIHFLVVVDELFCKP